ncbi:MAG: hypothetical protein ABFS34_13125 [Gemmatimonadota bacterium]
MLRLSTLVIVLLAVAPGAALTQTSDAAVDRTGERIVLPDAEEISLARSAAPPAVSAEATVLVYRPGIGYEVGHEGANGVTCFVDRSRVTSFEPQCFDREGSETILQVRLLEARLREEGRSEDDVQAAVDSGIRSGELRLPSRPVMTYMMSSGQVLISDDGRNVGAWKPHLMIYVPYLTADALGLGDTPSTRAAVVVNEGTALANIMIVVEEFVDPSEFAPDAGGQR